MTSQVQEPAPAADASTFEVCFPRPGRLGIEFRQLGPPYIVAQVHANAVASSLPISAGDELLSVAGELVTSLVWDDLVSRLSVRPTTALFRRAATAGKSPASDATQETRQKEPAPRRSNGAVHALAEVNRLKESAPRLSNGAVHALAEVNRLKEPAPRPSIGTVHALVEVNRLKELLRERDTEVSQLGTRLAQRDAALMRLEGASEHAAEVSQLVQERDTLDRHARQLQARVTELEKDNCLLSARHGDEARFREEERKRADSLTCQLETLRVTCQKLGEEARQKADFESQVQEMTRINALWQSAYDTLSQEAENKRSSVAGAVTAAAPQITVGTAAPAPPLQRMDAAQGVGGGAPHVPGASFAERSRSSGDLGQRPARPSLGWFGGWGQ